MQALVIGTTPGSSWLADCLASLDGYDKYPILMLSDYTWEVGKFRFIMDHTDLAEWFFLPDSVVVKDPTIFELAFESTHSYALSSGFKMFLGKYQRQHMPDLPTVTHKREAVLAESNWNWDYLRRDRETEVCSQPMEDTKTFEYKHGRQNMVIENDWLRKYKGTYLWEQVA